MIAHDGRTVLRGMRWGLVPFWAKDESTAFKTLNARSETAATAASFREPFRQRRCLVPADGFYEWAKTAHGKQPIRFVMRDERAFCLAGLWDRWRSPTGEVLQTFTVLTTGANDLVRPVHDRMPVILPPEHYRSWLAPALSEAAVIQELIRPFDAAAMRSYAVSPLVNSPRNDSPECLKPVEIEVQSELGLG